MTGFVAGPSMPGRVTHDVPAHGTHAGIASRTAANVIDFIVVATLLGSVYLGYAAFRFLLRPREFTFPAPTLWLVILTGSLLAAVYFTICWATSGRTYGDFVLGLKVVSRTGARVHLLAALLRALACVVVPLGLGWCGVDRTRRSLQDLLLRTSVVYDWPDAPHDAVRSA